MELLADRFVRLDPPYALDLASGRLVWWRRLRPAGAAVVDRWRQRCLLTSRLRHPNLAPLVDFGVWSAARRFEAYDVDGRAGRNVRVATTALREVVGFLRSCGLGRATIARRCAGLRAGEPVWIPDWCQSGEAATRPVPVGVGRRRGTAPAAGAGRIGLQLVERLALEEAVSALDEAGRYGSGPEWIAIRGPRGAGRTTLLLQLAREARLRGYVPVRASLLGGGRPAGCRLVPHALRALLAGRHLCVIADEPELEGWGTAEALARALPLAGRLGARPHVVLFPSSADADDRPGIDLSPLTTDELRRMVRIGTADVREVERAITRAAAGCAGQPGTFVRLLEQHCGRTPAKRVWATGVVTAAAAERPADYVVRLPPVGTPAHGPLEPQAAVSGLPVAAGGADWSHGARERGRRLIGCGRHAAAERVLRSALAGSARRRDDEGAAFAALQLGRLLLRRGRAVDAATVFDEAREGFSRAGLAAGCIVAGVWAGLACTDEGRLLEAETTLRMSVLAAEELDEPPALVRAGLALARCLFWQGRYDEARVALEKVGPVSGRALRNDGPGAELWAGPDPAVVQDALAARVAVGEERLGQAGRRARAAMDRAIALDEPAAVAIAAAARAFVCLWTGEVDAQDGVVRLGLAAARRAHAPLQSVRLRLLRALGLLDAGRGREAGRLLQGLARLAPRSAVPALLRVQVLQACGRQARRGVGPAAARTDGQAGSEERFIRERGAAAVRLFAPVGVRNAGVGASSLRVEHVVRLLQICHESGDEQTTVSRVADFLRERLRAAGVTFCVRSGERLSVITWAGSRLDRLETASRAADLERPTPPVPCRGGLERAVPIQLGNVCLGAIVCRWTAGTDVDHAAASGLMAAAAAATAMVVRLLADALRAVGSAETDRHLLGVSPVMTDLRRAIARAARAPFPVLVEGESGSGKELVARAIHQTGPRRHRRFCGLNCAAIPDELLEAELFGHARGAFTGAAVERPGLFEEADGGTLFMDEVGELSARAQAKVLRVLQEGEIRRLGETVPRRVDVRVIAATNRSLRAEAEAGRFRHDLLYRLDVVRITVPPLRDRIDDVPVLAAHFWPRAAARAGSRAVLAPATLAALARHDWPGNVRELQNVLSTLAVSGPQRGSVTPDALPPGLAAGTRGERRATLEEARRACDARVVQAALARVGGHRGRAAAELGLTRQGLTKLLARLGLAGAGTGCEPA